MPRLQAKVEGKGNGIKTVIANMTDIAKALGRPPTYPTKFFGCELGAQTHFDLKNERYIVNGEHDANKLQDLLDNFIKKFVLCTNCENPETGFTIKRGTIHSKCKACGHSFIIDPKHKLSTFIVKNPPPTTDAYGNATNGNDAEKKDNGSPVEDINGFEFKENVSNDDDDDDDWAEPTQEEVLTSHIGKLVIDKDLDKSVDERLDMLHQFFIKAKKDGSIKDSLKMLNEAERLELKTKAPLLLADVLLDQDVLKQLEENKNLFLRFLDGDEKAQRYFLGGIEQLIQKHTDVMKYAPHILMNAYNIGLLDEEVILAWAAKPSSKYIKKSLAGKIIEASKTFLDWLENAEEEEDDSDENEDGEGLEIAFDDRAQKVGTTETADAPKTNGTAAVAAPKAAPQAVVVGDEEFNIDDI
uniref:Eukaryotic translation initiation factor 5 n=1 Tax=Panagrellus redivivus TaxID=6233 RepID=A0A7E4VVD1_PANRE